MKKQKLRKSNLKKRERKFYFKFRVHTLKNELNCRMANREILEAIKTFTDEPQIFTRDYRLLYENKGVKGE